MGRAKKSDPLEVLAHELSEGHYAGVRARWDAKPLGKQARLRCLAALERGADPQGQIESPEGSTSLLCAAAAMGEDLLCERLLDLGADIESAIALPDGELGPTALGVACLGGFDALGAELGRRGANPNAMARLGRCRVSAAWVAIYLFREKTLAEVAARIDFAQEFRYPGIGKGQTENAWMCAALFSSQSFQLMVSLGLEPPSNLMSRLIGRGASQEIKDWLAGFFAKGQAQAISSAMGASPKPAPSHRTRL